MKTTLKSFIKASNIEASLIRAVVKNCHGWESFKEMSQDVCNHGASAGFGRFCYYVDTVAFTAKNKKAILAYCKEMDSQIENVGIISFITSFNCLEGYDQDEIAAAIYGRPTFDEKVAVYNALAWFALEEVCRAYCDFKEAI